MCRQRHRTENIARGTTASPAVKNNSIEQVMCADYSSINLVNQDSSGWGVYEDFVIREHYGRCGAGASIYEDSAGPEWLPGGEVCDGGQ
jgi:hypothetical protein